MNPESQLIKEGAGSYYLRGAANYQTVSGLAEADFLDGSAKVNIDLTGLQSADSSAIALLLHWQRQARREGVQLHFLNIPEQIKPLITLYDLDGIISNS